MPKFEVMAGRVFWGVGTIFVAVILVGIALSVLENHYPNLLSRAPIPDRQAKPEVFMPPLKDIKLVLGRDDVRNPGVRVKNALRACISSPPALIGTGRGARIEAFLANATETDVFYFYCASPEVWKMLAGRAGFVKMREGKPVDELILFMN
ncbi:MAG: hypothetical protein ACYCY9_05980 [Thiobacillus sp.]